MKRLNRMCPICFLKQLFTPKKRAESLAGGEPYNNGIELPPMGWSSWNCFRNKINEQCILDIADCMVKGGLLEAGYKYLNLDDCWHSSQRDEEGRLQGDYGTFPGGIAPLIKKINEKGLKVGLYSSNGTLTCEDLPASLGREQVDADTIARWGAEYFKYDFCHNVPISGYAPLIATVSLAKMDSGKGDGIVISASSGRLTGTAMAFKDKKMPTGTYVSGLDRNSGTLTLENVMVEEEGEYALTITTKKSGGYEKYVRATINGGKSVGLTVPPCKIFNHTARTQAKVYLQKGNNVISFCNPVSNRADSAILQYRDMGEALKKAAAKAAAEKGGEIKPILFSICEWGRNEPWKWGRTAGNIWRTTMDIRPWWIWMMYIYNKTVELYKYSGKGAFNDPDMLEVGNGKLTENENRTHFSLWCLMNAPLILGNDLRKLVKPDGSVDTDSPIIKIATNKKLIALNQDSLCLSAKRVQKGKIDVLAKPLSDGVAVALFNKTKKNKIASYDLKKLCGDEYVKLFDAQSYAIENLWEEKSGAGTTVQAELGGRSIAVFKITRA